MATTVESLLTSLQAHLTIQTPLIPSLHAQLGLPSSALTEDLDELHRALVECVDAKIEERRKEVDEWMERCRLVEAQCLKYVKALGSHAKVSASSVGELRKQQVLPKRYENLLSCQEKLKQLYQTKFEQALGLTNKINSYIHIVGPGFFNPELVSMTLPAGIQPGEEMDTLKDVTPERSSRLEKEIARAKTEIIRRLTLLSQTFLKIGWLHEELGILLPMDCDLTSISAPRSVSDPFLSGSTTAKPEDSLPSYHTIFGRFVARLQEASDESLDLDSPGNEMFGVEGVQPTLGLMKWAERTQVDLEDIKARREDHIQALYNELDSLWRRLGVSEADMDAFVEANRGSTEANVQAYELELERMLELRRESMSTFIANARAELDRLWEELRFGKEEREAFPPYSDNEHTEELLTLHEKEIQRLKEERVIKAPILAMIKKYYEICEEEKELAAAASDQSRLLGRGPREPGRLLREEKMRKRVSKEKPRLEKELMVCIPAWENEHRRPFLVDGERMLAILSDAVNASEIKDGRKRGRPGAIPSRGTTPQPSADRATPGPLEYPGGSHTMPNKKIRLGNANILGNSSVVNGVSYNCHRTDSSSPQKPSADTPGNHKLFIHKSGSSLPRPISHSKSKYGHGQPPTVIPSFGRTVSNPGVSIFNGGRSGHRRESFKPRPSVDGRTTSMMSGTERQWAPFVGSAVKEEEEY